MKKRIVSLLALTTMTATMFAGCGSSNTTATDTTADNSAATTETETAALPEDTGKVLNIHCWNDEFQSRMKAHYKNYEEVDATHGKIGDVNVVWTITPSTDNAYQNNLDEALLKQADASADDKVDLFLVEADYALKYVDTDYAMALSDLGITDADLSDQYKYTQSIVTDSNGKLKGSSWQACSAGLIYNRDAAKEVLGTDDPDEVQAAVGDWDKFKETAAKVADAGYTMCSVNDTYRVYSNNVSGKWVQDNKVVIDKNIEKWIDDSKELVDAKAEDTDDLWGDDWAKGKNPEGKVFCYFGPAWMINFSMKADEAGSIAYDGGWGATEGPQGFFWGGTWICAAEGTDNASLVADIMKQLTTNKDIMLDIVSKDSDFVNNKPAMEEAATKDEFAFKPLGGQNPIAMFCNGAEKCDLSNQCEYDQGCNEEFQKAMKNYFDGNASLDDALAMFNSAIVEKYPDVTAE